MQKIMMQKFKEVQLFKQQSFLQQFRKFDQLLDYQVHLAKQSRNFKLLAPINQFQASSDAQHSESITSANPTDKGSSQNKTTKTSEASKAIEDSQEPHKLMNISKIKISEVLEYCKDPSRMSKLLSFEQDKNQCETSLDSEIKLKFQELLEAAGSVEKKASIRKLAKDNTYAAGLVVLFDTLPRFIYRGTKRAFEFEEKALDIAKDVIEDERIYDLPDAASKVFMLMPLLNSESIIDKFEGIEVLNVLIEKCNNAADKTRFKNLRTQMDQDTDILVKFLRFPDRNQVLGRQTTPEEEYFLNEIEEKKRIQEREA